ncbi:MAG: hypothetical protein ACTHM0_13480 [Sphingomonas sp.]
MTKVRPPLTVENALFAVLGRIGAERAAEVTARDKGYILSLSNPDNRYRLTVDDAIALDLEHIAQGGAGAPIYELYGRRLDIAGADRFADAAAIAKLTLAMIKEGGEAHAALVATTFAGAGPHELRHALTQLEDLDAIVDQAIALVRARAPP